MLRLNRDNLFVKQNNLLKLAILLIGSITAIIIPFRALSLLYIFTCVYMLISPIVFKHMLRGLVNFLPFLAMYSLFATIYSVQFETMLIFLFRMSFLIINVVVFTDSFYLSRLIEDISLRKKSKTIGNFLYFIIATLIYIHYMTEYYSKGSKDRNAVNHRVSGIITNLVDAIHINWNKRDEIQFEVEKRLQIEYDKPSLVNKANTFGIMYLTVIVLILSL